MNSAPEERFILEALGRGLIAALLVSLLALIWGAKVAAGVAAGAVLGLGSLWLLNRLSPRICRTRKPKFWFWLLWLVKLPLFCLLIYLLISGEMISAVAFCVGIAIVPITFVVLALRPKREGL